jgi:hypothetical protein
MRALIVSALFAAMLTACGSDRPSIPVSPSPPPVLMLFRDDGGADGGVDAR